MSVVESVFVATEETPAQVAAWLVGVARCEVTAAEGSLIRLRMPATVHDGWYGVVVQPNGYVEVDPEPDDVQAMDPYDIEIQLRGGRDEAALRAEAGLLFAALVHDRADLPMLLVHDLAILVAAHMPGVGTRSFDWPTTPDGPDIAVWRGWAVERRSHGE
ncbi:hypothetical protein GCM10009630_65450 [Kribbella jejuensis]|uniref:Uncharacterized protein n=1 Tax=Kribbella jejuensis TaxID=236068 RepID=A0A542ELV0_9ACTN|nr:hypothetical protein [Kribbella jejuensis]TQJ16322.1 hypothetical protein FB475_0415 [Kribbella jejuensis]